MLRTGVKLPNCETRRLVDPRFASYMLYWMPWAQAWLIRHNPFQTTNTQNKGVPKMWCTASSSRNQPIKSTSTQALRNTAMIDRRGGLRHPWTKILNRNRYRNFGLFQAISNHFRLQTADGHCNWLRSAARQHPREFTFGRMAFAPKRRIEEFLGSLGCHGLDISGLSNHKHIKHQLRINM